MGFPRLPTMMVFLALAACENNEQRYDAGYGDGYAVGYNTACEIRATLIAGKFDDANYARGYADGTTAGMIACSADRKAGRVE